MDSVMRPSDIEAKLTATRQQWGDWTAHNIELAPGVFTISNKVRGDERAVHRCLQTIADHLRKPFQELRVLDLGCLEGLYSVELARHGAEVVGLEVRDANLEKAKAVKEILGLKKLDFVRDDVRNLSLDKYGQFDVILCVGLLYHLDQPDVFKVIEKMYSCCKGILILDLHVSLHRQVKIQYKDNTYEGLYYPEHDPSLTPEQKEKSLWASIDNIKSFWFTRPSLYNCLKHVGFSSVYECLNPADPTKVLDRITLVASCGQHIPYLSSTPFAGLPIPDWPEDDRPAGFYQKALEPSTALVSAPRPEEGLVSHVRSALRLRTRLRQAKAKVSSWL